MIAVYARQSVEKKDSISIESQIEACMARILESERNQVKVYEDRGFSGKSTNRPAFQEMMEAVRSGLVNKVIVYKLDRISRSLFDFLQIRQTLELHNTDFISCSEQFDTSTPNGKLMVNMLMAFAEMERETIQKRIADNYYARGEKGFYLGGYAPFGYQKVETYLYGKKTYTFEIVPEEADILCRLFEKYLSGVSMISITKWLNTCEIKTRRGKAWSQNHISRLLRNPVYVRADADVYHFLKAQGATLNNPIEDYTGENGCILYGSVEKRTGTKFANMSTDFITLGLHKGIVEPSLWLEVQYLIKSKCFHSNLGSGTHSWLQGIIKCTCGSTLYVHKCTNKNKKAADSVYSYFYCRNRKNGTCAANAKMVRVDKVELIAQELLFSRIEELSSVQIGEEKTDNRELNDIKVKIAKVEEKIGNLMAQVASGSSVTAKYLNSAIEELDREKCRLTDEALQIQIKANRQNSHRPKIETIRSEWNGYSVRQKQSIAKQIFTKITIGEGNITVEYA